MRLMRAGRDLRLLVTIGAIFLSITVLLALRSQNVSILATHLEHVNDYKNTTSATSIMTGTLPCCDAPFSIMVVGDSITQGIEGDWTWRYRLWQWFQSEGVAVNFVGPFKGTRPPGSAVSPTSPDMPEANPDANNSATTSGGYAIGVDPNFDSDHFGAWGRQLHHDKSLIQDIVAQYEPDYLLVLLGFNDVGWFASDAAGTIDSMATFITRARAAKPNIKFALGNIPQRTHINGRDDLPIKTDQYNQMLASKISMWSTATSPIQLVQMRENYACELDICPAGYDGLHPNVLGEYQIAQAFSRTLLHGYGIGGKELSIPGDLPVRKLQVPANIVAASSSLGVTVTWDHIYGAVGYEIQSRVQGNAAWSLSSAGTNRYDTTWTVDGLTWEYMIRMSNGDNVKSAWSGIVSAIAHPETSSLPTNNTAVSSSITTRDER